MFDSVSRSNKNGRGQSKKEGSRSKSNLVYNNYGTL